MKYRKKELGGSFLSVNKNVVSPNNCGCIMQSKGVKSDGVENGAPIMLPENRTMYCARVLGV